LLQQKSGFADVDALALLHHGGEFSG
jgi:hypothetical protein